MTRRTRLITLSLAAITSLGAAFGMAGNWPCQTSPSTPAAGNAGNPSRSIPVAVVREERTQTQKSARKAMPTRTAMKPMAAKKTAMRSMQRDIIQTAVGPGMQTVTTLVKAVQAANLVEALRGEGPFTVFAPTNDAFAKLPEGTLNKLLDPKNQQQLRSILLYHVHVGRAIRDEDLRDGKLSTVNGQSLEVKRDGPTVMINNATVTKTDVIASNGVIHWIDTVVLPQAMKAPKNTMMMKQGQARDIVQTAVGPGMQTVTTLVKAVQAAELVDALRGPGPFTVFAPTNDAFAKLPKETLAELLKPENKEQLRSILLYHVHAGEAIRSADLREGELSTLNGQAVDIQVAGPTVMVENATITKTDVIASNGVIHWLDTVILP